MFCGVRWPLLVKFLAIVVASFLAQPSFYVNQSRAADMSSPSTTSGKGELSSLGSVHVPGYTFGLQVSGNFAYLPYGGGVHVVDVATPTQPKMVQTISTERAQSVFLSGPNIFIGGRSLDIFDVSNPLKPTPVSSISAFDRQINCISVLGNRAFVFTPRMVTVVDIGDAKHPQVTGRLDIPASEIAGCAVSGKYAYVAASTDGLQIIDISDGTQPRIAGAIKLPGAAAVGVQTAGSYAFIAGHSGGLIAVDVSDVSRPIETGRMKLSGPVRAVYVSGTRALIALFDHSIKTVDVEDPLSMRVISEFRTEGYADLVQGIQVIDGTAYVAGNLDQTSSVLQVIDLDSTTKR
jgi:hypothetical protein